MWDPHTKELKSQIEMVQRRAARFVMSDYNQQSSVSLMLQKLQWQSLNERRAHSKTIMLYRIMNCLVAIPAAPPYVFLSSEGTRGHHLQLRQQHCRILTYQHSFFPSVVHLWKHPRGNPGQLDTDPGRLDTNYACRVVQGLL